MATIGFDTLQCNTLTHGGWGNDHIRLLFYVDVPDTSNLNSLPLPQGWPRDGQMMEASETLSMQTAMAFDFTSNLVVQLINYHHGQSDEPELLGSHVYLPDGAGSNQTTFDAYDSSYTLTYTYLQPGQTFKYVQLLSLLCIKPATSIDGAVIKSITDALGAVAQAFGDAMKNVQDPRAVAAGVAVSAAGQVLQKIPDIAHAIAEAGNYNDQLYIALGGNTSRGQKIYPNAAYWEMNTGSLVSLASYNLGFPIINVTTFTLFEADQSNDDWLGSIVIDDGAASGFGQQVVVGPESEGSVYIASYEIMTSPDWQDLKQKRSRIAKYY